MTAAMLNEVRPFGAMPISPFTFSLYVFSPSSFPSLSDTHSLSSTQS